MEERTLELLTRQGITRGAVEELSRLNDEPEWLRKMRLLAWSIYESSPVPPWKRIDLSSIHLDELTAFAPGEKPVADVAVANSIFSGDEARGGRIVQTNSVVDETLGSPLDPSLSMKGVVFTSLEKAAATHPEMVRKHLFVDAVKLTENRFVAMNGALWGGGMFLYVPPFTEITSPLQYTLIAAQSGAALFPHLLIIVGEGSSLTFVDQSTTIGVDGPALASQVVEIFANPGAQVNYVSVQEFSRTAKNFALKRAILSRDSRMIWTEIGVGSKVSRVSAEAILRDPGSEVQLLGLYFGQGEQRLEYDTLQLHAAPHTKSDLLYKGALREKAHSVFNGLIRVERGAQRTDAYQANRNLLLSNTSRADSLPTLEIEANDVRCTHGATVGPIDPDQLFYLLARGIERETAEKLLVLGFYEAVLQKIPLEELREAIRNYIERELE